MTALIVGAVIALAALALVLEPLFRSGPPKRAATPPPRPVSRADQAVAALREVEFDRETGKLSDPDYAALKAEYTREALEALRAEDARGASADARAEALIRSQGAAPVSCPACGPRPEGDAIYCSSCGRYLGGACAACGAEVQGSGAHFCAACGSRLAA